MLRLFSKVKVINQNQLNVFSNLVLTIEDNKYFKRKVKKK